MKPDVPDISFRNRVEEYLRSLQQSICVGLEMADGRVKFPEERWAHPSGGSGITRVVQHGDIFEKAGVNFSAVRSTLTEKLALRMEVPPQDVFATGISVVLHPLSPMIPAVHMNLRYLELADGDAWFGGGTDLTPYYLFEEDVRHFHSSLKSVCDSYDPEWYPRFKKWCDEYFFLSHRNEARGVGGIFFDNQRGDKELFFRFIQDIGNIFLSVYLSIVDRRRNDKWRKPEKDWQLIRRGRYVEFNLIYDRGTLFGLETGGRTESILISLPPEVWWRYDHRPEPGSREEALCKVLQHPRMWT
jgi:coproporphyrinogen III oxidase